MYQHLCFERSTLRGKALASPDHPFLKPRSLTPDIYKEEKKTKKERKKEGRKKKEKKEGKEERGKKKIKKENEEIKK
jgi:hypothetical protein